MTCLSTGELRSYLDGEISGTAALHVQNCPHCTEKLGRLRESSEEVSALLDAGSHAPDSVAAYGDFVAQHGDVQARAPFRRPVWLGAAVCCVFIVVLSFSPAHSWGQRILNMLRVQKVAVVPLDLEALSTATNGHEKLLTQMISDRVVVTMKPGEPTAVDNASAASGAAGFDVRSLDTLGAPSRILVRDEAAFHIQLDRDRMLALLDAVGRPDIAVPDNLDGSVIAVHIPKIVELNYGECGAHKSAGCLHFTQLQSPVISVPPSLNIAALAEAMLQLTGMSATEAHSFCQSVDWSSTLVLPIPLHSSSSRTIQVDGVNGTLIESAAQGRHPSEYALIWVKNQRIYSISGPGTPDQALAVAESLN